MCVSSQCYLPHLECLDPSELCPIPGPRGEGSDLPSCHQTTKVALTESAPESLIAFILINK